MTCLGPQNAADAQAQTTHGEGATYPNWEWISPTLSVKRFMEIVDCLSPKLDELIHNFCRDKSKLTAEELEAMTFLANDGFIPSPPDKLMPQEDIDGLLFVALPDSMPLEECRKWLSYRLMEYALAMVEERESWGCKNVCIDRFLEPTRENVDGAMSLWNAKEREKLSGPELERQAAEAWKLLQERRPPEKRREYSIRYIENGCPATNPLAMKWDAKKRQGVFLRPSLAYTTIYLSRKKMVERFSPEERSKKIWVDWVKEFERFAPPEDRAAPAPAPESMPERQQPMPTPQPEPVPVPAEPAASIPAPDVPVAEPPAAEPFPDGNPIQSEIAPPVAPSLSPPPVQDAALDALPAQPPDDIAAPDTLPDFSDDALPAFTDDIGL